MTLYRLVATVGSEAPRTTSSCVNAGDHPADGEQEVLTVLGGKASCRRKFVINVHLLDEDDNLVGNEDLSVVATVAYAHDRSPIVQQDAATDTSNNSSLFLAEPPLLTTFNGVEYPSHDRPTRLVAGKASFKLAISLLSSKYDNRLFCICFTPTASDGSPANAATLSCQPCYSKPIRSISRKRSSTQPNNSSANNSSHHHHHHQPHPHPHNINHHQHHHHQQQQQSQQHNSLQPHSTPGNININGDNNINHLHHLTHHSSASHLPKIKSPPEDHLTSAAEEVDKFFRASATTSASSEEETEDHDTANGAISQQPDHFPPIKNAAPPTLDFDSSDQNSPQTDGSLRYISSNDYKQEAHLLPRESIYGSSADESPCALITTSTNIGPHENLCARSVHSAEALPTFILHSQQQQHHHHHHPSTIVSVMDGTGPVSPSSFFVNGGAGISSKLQMDASRNSGRFSPHTLISRSESTSPISGILCTSDGSMEHEAFSQPSPSGLTQRPLSAPHPGSQLSSPFRPYVSSRVSAGAAEPFRNGSSNTATQLHSLRRHSGSPVEIDHQIGQQLQHNAAMPDVVVNGRPLNIDNTSALVQAGAPAGAASNQQSSLDAVLQRFLAEATSACSHHAAGTATGLSTSVTDHNNWSSNNCMINSFEDEEQSLLSMEVALQQAMREVEKKKEELRSKRRRLQLVEDEARIHNIVFQSSSWVESLSSRFNL